MKPVEDFLPLQVFSAFPDMLPYLPCRSIKGSPSKLWNFWSASQHVFWAFWVHTKAGFSCFNQSSRNQDFFERWGEAIYFGFFLQFNAWLRVKLSLCFFPLWDSPPPAVYVAVLAKAKTAIWNGPMGVFELEHFKEGLRTPTWLHTRHFPSGLALLCRRSGKHPPQSPVKGGSKPSPLLTDSAPPSPVVVPVERIFRFCGWCRLFFLCCFLELFIPVVSFGPSGYIVGFGCARVLFPFTLGLLIPTMKQPGDSISPPSGFVFFWNAFVLLLHMLSCYHLFEGCQRVFIKGRLLEWAAIPMHLLRPPPPPPAGTWAVARTLAEHSPQGPARPEGPARGLWPLVPLSSPCDPKSQSEYQHQFPFLCAVLQSWFHHRICYHYSAGCFDVQPPQNYSFLASRPLQVGWPKAWCCLGADDIFRRGYRIIRIICNTQVSFRLSP